MTHFHVPHAVLILSHLCPKAAETKAMEFLQSEIKAEVYTSDGKANQEATEAESLPEHIASWVFTEAESLPEHIASWVFTM